MFLRNLLLDEKNELHNRSMHISGRFTEVDIERVLMPFAKLKQADLPPVFNMSRKGAVCWELIATIP